jgi:hypothetical protein
MINLPMKLNKTELIISFIVLVIFCSAISVSSMAENQRWTLAAINPWNGVAGLAFVVNYFLHVGVAFAYAITVGMFLILWWRLYVVIVKIITAWKGR